MEEGLDAAGKFFTLRVGQLDRKLVILSFIRPGSFPILLSGLHVDRILFGLGIAREPARSSGETGSGIDAANRSAVAQPLDDLGLFLVFAEQSHPTDLCDLTLSTLLPFRFALCPRLDPARDLR